MNTENRYDIMVCEDCYFAHHYGATERDGQWYAGESDTASDHKPLGLVDDADELTDNTDSETGEGIEEFARSRCEGCGSRLGGSRYRLAVWPAAPLVDIDHVMAGYTECAIWSSLDYSNLGPDDDDSDNEPRPMDENYGPDDIADETLATMREECLQFITANRKDLAASGLDASQIGHDFWLTRNGHGAGFWDRGLGDIGTRLSDTAKVWGTVDLYAGDDGKLYA